MNTIITFGFLLIALVAALVVFIDTDVPRWWIASGGIGLAIVVPPFIDPFTRTFWTAIDIGMRPLEAHEVDWNVVAPGWAGNTAGQSGLPSDGSSTTTEPPPKKGPDS